MGLLDSLDFAGMERGIGWESGVCMCVEVRGDVCAGARACVRV